MNEVYFLSKFKGIWDTEDVLQASNYFVFWSRIFVLFEPYVRFHILVQSGN